MPTIPSGHASPIFTTAVVKKFDELKEVKVNNFFRSFFPDLASPERYPIIEVRRGTEKVAVDVVRGTQGNRIQVSKFAQKALDPFYYKNYFDATTLQQYFRVFGSTSFNTNEMAELANGVAVEMKGMQDMVDRAIELHAANVLLTGTCTSLRDSSIIDFKRRASSMVTLTGGNTWDTAGTNPYTDLSNGCQFLRNTGKYAGKEVFGIFGLQAWQAFRANAEVKDRLKQFHNYRDIIDKTYMDTIGANYQMSIDCDTHIVHVFTYTEIYEDASGTQTQYMDPKKIILLPPNPGFNTIFGAIPSVRQQGATTGSLIAQPTVIKRFVNEEMGYDRHYLESSPLPVPIQVDRIYTLQPIA